MEIRRQEEQLDWVEHTQKGQDAYFVAAHISKNAHNTESAPSFRPRSLAIGPDRTCTGKTRVPDLPINIQGEDVL